MGGFAANQVVTFKLDGESKTVWQISPPQRQKLINRLRSSKKFQVEIEWTLIKYACGTAQTGGTILDVKPRKKISQPRVMAHYE